MRKSLATGIICLFFLVSCGRTRETGSAVEPESLTPVTVTHPVVGSLSEVITLNATSRFLLKTSVKSDINGYLQKVQIHLGQRINRGQELFEIRSKESEHLGNTINKLDTAFHFNGTVSVKSPSDGYITELSYKAGDYVQDNEILATISHISSLVFLLELPYELSRYLPDNKKVDLLLPDGNKLKGTIESSLPAVDPVSQTRLCVIHVNGISSIPENLVATVEFVKKSRPDIVTLPKASLLTDEAQNEFWIMKMTDSSTAIRVPVKVGLVTSDKVEILSPVLTASDIILLTGNYGLPDTSKVIIQNRK
jgi:multidrug efflux pump subunit AcrA (membrane-fusion protein)